MHFRFALAAAALVSSVAPSFPSLPDPEKTPGAVLETVPDVSGLQASAAPQPSGPCGGA
jgi:hypothetical protein